MPSVQPRRIKTISAFHQLRGLPKPEHPLISVINFAPVEHPTDNDTTSIFFDFYSIVLKRNFYAKMKYGQEAYDFDKGVLAFMSPGQVFSIPSDAAYALSGWMILVHPDFLWNTPLAKIISRYEFFNYAVNEALHLSEKEEAILTNIVQNLEQEYHSNIDGFSQNVMIAQLELLLTYSDRFYNRQFITRKISSHQILEKLERFLHDYFGGDEITSKGLPSVQLIAEQLNVSQNYLGSLLKVLTGQSTQQHIHNKLIEKAKEKLSTTDLTVSEIAYTLGFEHSQSFSKIFKAKTTYSPSEFRQSFN